MSVENSGGGTSKNRTYMTIFFSEHQSVEICRFYSKHFMHKHDPFSEYLTAQLNIAAAVH